MCPLIKTWGASNANDRRSVPLEPSLLCGKRITLTTMPSTSWQLECASCVSRSGYVNELHVMKIATVCAQIAAVRVW